MQQLAGGKWQQRGSRLDPAAAAAAAAAASLLRFSHLRRYINAKGPLRHALGLDLVTRVCVCMSAERLYLRKRPYAKIANLVTR